MGKFQTWKSHRVVRNLKVQDPKFLLQSFSNRKLRNHFVILCSGNMRGDSVNVESRTDVGGDAEQRYMNIQFFIRLASKGSGAVYPSS